MRGERPRLGREQGVAVGLGRRDVGGAERAAGARPVLDDHRLAPALRQPVGQDARDHVGPAGRRRRDDDPHGAVRVVGGFVLLLRERGGGGERAGEDRQDDLRHRVTPVRSGPICHCERSEAISLRLRMPCAAEIASPRFARLAMTRGEASARNLRGGLVLGRELGVELIHLGDRRPPGHALHVVHDHRHLGDQLEHGGPARAPCPTARRPRSCARRAGTGPWRAGRSPS